MEYIRGCTRYSVHCTSLSSHHTLAEELSGTAAALAVISEFLEDRVGEDIFSNPLLDNSKQVGAARELIKR